MINVCIGVPSGNLLHAGFLNSLFNMQRFVYQHPLPDKLLDLKLLNVRTSILPLSRTAIVKYAINNQAHWLLMVDSDMTFPPDALYRLLAHRAPVVGTVAARRDGKGMSALYGPDIPRRGLVQVDRLGTGFLLVDMDIFTGSNPLPKPWFDITMSQETQKAEEFDMECTGEDVYFSYRLREHGVPLLLDWELSFRIGHLGETEYYLQPEQP